MFNIKAWAKKYLPHLQRDTINMKSSLNEDAPLLNSNLVNNGDSNEDEDWDILYDMDLKNSAHPYSVQKHELTLKQKVKSRFHYYIPVFSWLPKYDIKNQVPKDLMAGIGVATMMVPQALAYAILAGVPVVFGLLTAFVCKIFVYDSDFFRFQSLFIFSSLPVGNYLLVQTPCHRCSLVLHYHQALSQPGNLKYWLLYLPFLLVFFS